MRRIEREIRDYVVRRYLKGVGSTTLERETGVHNSTILKIIRQAGYATRPRGNKPLKNHCIEMDCERPTNGRWRCSLHLRMHNAETALDRQWKRKGKKCKCGRECIGKECRSCSNRRTMKRRRSLCV